MSVSEPQSVDSGGAGGYGAFYPAGYQALQPEEHGLDRGFRLTAFSDMKGWGCKVPQETLLKLLQGLEPDRPPGEDGGSGTGVGDETADFGQLVSVPQGPRLGKVWAARWPVKKRAMFRSFESNLSKESVTKIAIRPRNQSLLVLVRAFEVKRGFACDRAKRK